MKKLLLTLSILILPVVCIHAENNLENQVNAVLEKAYYAASQAQHNDEWVGYDLQTKQTFSLNLPVARVAKAYITNPHAIPREME